MILMKIENKIESKYIIGKTYITQVDLNVRNGAGIKYKKKKIFRTIEETYFILAYITTENSYITTSYSMSKISAARLNTHGAFEGRDNNSPDVDFANDGEIENCYFMLEKVEDFSYELIEIAPEKLAGGDFIRNGADIVVGNHPHVIQGLRVENGKTTLYSLGNFVFGGNHTGDPDDFIQRNISIYIFQYTFFLLNNSHFYL